ncbi:MAG: disulfide bond formation protein B [Actinomycetota bacterium]
MSADTVTTFFALLALASLGFVLATAGARLLRRRGPWWDRLVATVGPSGLVLAAFVAVVATLGSLYLSEVANFPPCRMCWYQRTAMYPLAVILVLAAIRRDVAVVRYARLLAVIGAAISGYHVLLERFPALETGACEVDNPCSIVWVRHLGVFTIPFMAGSGFLAIIAATALAAAAARSEEHSP